MKNAVAYLRVSGKGQVKGHGFKRQREEINRYAKQNGYEIITFYEEVYLEKINERFRKNIKRRKSNNL